jgi:hypothetical protein
MDQMKELQGIRDMLEEAHTSNSHMNWIQDKPDEEKGSDGIGHFKMKAIKNSRGIDANLEAS